MVTDVIKGHWRILASKMSNSKIIKIRAGCQYIEYIYYSENLNWAAQNLRLGRGLDIAALSISVV